MTTTPTAQRPLGSRAAAICNHVVRTMSEYTGRGPTKSRTYINDDVVTVVLQDTLTTGERRLVSDGLNELVLTMRAAFQGIMRADLIAGVEEILGRKVEVVLSDHHIDPDIAVEVFVLAPPDASDGARGAARLPTKRWPASTPPTIAKPTGSPRSNALDTRSRRSS